MKDFIVVMKLEVVIEADNPGHAVSIAIMRLQKLLETNDPLLLTSILMEAVAYPADTVPMRH